MSVNSADGSSNGGREKEGCHDKCPQGKYVSMESFRLNGDLYTTRVCRPCKDRTGCLSCVGPEQRDCVQCVQGRYLRHTDHMCVPLASSRDISDDDVYEELNPRTGATGGGSNGGEPVAVTNFWLLAAAIVFVGVAAFAAILYAQRMRWRVAGRGLSESKYQHLPADDRDGHDEPQQSMMTMMMMENDEDDADDEEVFSLQVDVNTNLIGSSGGGGGGGSVSSSNSAV